MVWSTLCLGRTVVVWSTLCLGRTVVVWSTLCLGRTSWAQFSGIHFWVGHLQHKAE